MSKDTSPPAEPEGEEKSQFRELVLDDLEKQFDTFQALRKSDAGAADSVLEDLGAQGDVDRDIVLELSSPRPLGHPDRFSEAHRLAVRGLEVLDRNGGRGVAVRGLGPLGPVAAFLTQQMAQFIIRSHQSNVASAMLHLYGRREANAAPDDPALPLLRRARIQMERLTPGFRKNALGIPIFVVGGALFSTILSLTQQALATALSSLWGRIIATVVIGLIMAAVAWVIVRGAAVARRRIKLSLDGPLKALWETVGRCGDPPRDPAKVFGLIGIIIALLPWILIPTGLLVSWITELF